MIPIILFTVLLGFVSAMMLTAPETLLETAWGKIAVWVFWMAVGAAFGAGIGALDAVAVGVKSNGTLIQCNSQSTSLQSIGGAAGTTGSFLFVDQAFTYHYFTKDGNSYSAHDEAGHFAVLHEDATPETAHVVIHHPYIVFPLSLVTIGEGGFGCETEFFVPKGTVTQQYQVKP